MKIKATKREVFEVMVAHKPVLFTVAEQWHGLSLLRDELGRTIIARIDDDPLDRALRSAFMLGSKRMEHTLVALICSPELVGKLTEDVSGETTEPGGGSKV